LQFHANPCTFVQPLAISEITQYVLRSCLYILGFNSLHIRGLTHVLIHMETEIQRITNENRIWSRSYIL
jgi:hypothetical protein